MRWQQPSHRRWQHAPTDQSTVPSCHGWLPANFIVRLGKCCSLENMPIGACRTNGLLGAAPNARVRLGLNEPGLSCVAQS
eukprot:scaffold148701_cov31-Tisochrysis_lutea.AAC.2